MRDERKTKRDAATSSLHLPPRCSAPRGGRRLQRPAAPARGRHWGPEEPVMKKQGICYVLTAILVGLFAFSSGAMAERPPGVGGGNGGGHDSGNEPPDYGDLFILYRDEYGVPLLTADDCQQPLAAEAFEGCIQIPGTTDEADCRIIPVDPATCSVEGPYSIHTQEVDFGRINEARSPDSVFESQLEEARLTLATAGCLGLDPAGRPVASSVIDPDAAVEGDEYVATSTIDSPLQHLAMYRALMLEGAIGENIDLPRDWMAAAATSLGAAADKSGFVGVDLVVYLNEILGLTEESANAMLDTRCIDVKEEVMGVIQHVRKCFLDFSAYTYNRAATFGYLPYPAYIPAGDPQDGVFEYLHEFDTANHWFTIETGPILAAVPELADSYDGSNVGAFATAADDSRAVIDFFHTWPVPGDYATPVLCEAGADVYYDVSISADSGLQVPKRMVADTEGREGTLTVANAGPADATGFVKLTGIDSEGEAVGPLYLIDGGIVTETELFVGTEYTEPFTLAAGYSTSWTFFFSMDYATTIEWTAEVMAEDDVNASNDVVTETTVVTAVKAGGGGGGGGSGGGRDR